MRQSKITIAHLDIILALLQRLDDVKSFTLKKVLRERKLLSNNYGREAMLGSLKETKSPGAKLSGGLLFLPDKTECKNKC